MRPSLPLVLLLAIASCSDGSATTADTTQAEGEITDVGADTSASAPTQSPDRTTEPMEPNATIDRVVDGDTIIVEVQGQRDRVRLIGIDTPESVDQDRPRQCYGAESSSYLSSLLPAGTPVTLIRDVEARDQYDRLLAYVVRSDDGLFVNLELVANGYAGPLTYPPNDFYADLLEGAAADAAAAGIGLWSACGGPDVPLG